MRRDKPTSIRLSPELKDELAKAAKEQGVTPHETTVGVLNDWLSKRLRAKAKPDEGILKK